MKKVYSFTRKGIDFEVTKDTKGFYTIEGTEGDIILCYAISKTFGDAYRMILRQLKDF